MNKSQALRFKRLCREAAKELGVAATAEVAVTLATYKLQRYALQSRLIGGGVVNTAELQQVDEAIKAIRPAAGPLKVEIEFVGPSLTQCPQCDHVFDPDTPERTVAKKTPRTIDAEAIKSDAKQLPPPEVRAAPAPPPAPPPPPRLDPSVSSASGFHNQVIGGERAPLKRLQNVALQNNGHTQSRANENYGNNVGVAWSGYMDGKRPYGAARPDQNPSYNSDGSPRDPYKPPH